MAKPFAQAVLIKGDKRPCEMGLEQFTDLTGFSVYRCQLIQRYGLTLLLTAESTANEFIIQITCYDILAY